MVESRCGLLCSGCKYQEEMGCKGCVNIAQPFWGKCPVKDCCEEKGHTHCGQCGAFPCQQLTQFAYDELQGDDGKRLEQCRHWKEAAK
ncbi:DUF3795 domain-containing protein [Acutalibacter caecimuris]|uniref:DUF3795 domain-containing protein n=1 Tax=Acutalibacter caecimuris TaxID=3093657 RepID=UPI002AC8E22A|nr:DUF3795 domain-containing protein [Acutalibacter sp. M00118]